MRQAHKLSGLVSQLLDMSRIEGGRLTLERKCVDLVHIVDDVAATARLASTRHHIATRAPSSAEVFVDPLRVEQVFTNLLNNAVQYSSSGPIEIGVVASDRIVRVAVRDHGIGIAAKHLPHIFERFYRVNHGRHAAGLGLGLYISNQIVALHGGRIDVESPPDGGTCFTVVLPNSPAHCAMTPAS